MKAMYYTKYGHSEVLSLRDVEIPTPKKGEVLVKVHASSINSWDWDLIRGYPIWARFWGLTRPRYRIPGADIAGIVEDVGEGVTTYKTGDAVYGDLCENGWGGFAEYVCTREDALALKPANLTFGQAAAAPQAAVIALQGIRDYGSVEKGHKVLINGAGGGIGTFAIQLAKRRGAEVTGVDSTGKQDIMRELGADHVIDYTAEDFTENYGAYDLILDMMTLRPMKAYRRALKPDGRFLFVGGTVGRALQLVVYAPYVSITGSKKMQFLAHKPNHELSYITGLLDDGTITPDIDRVYPLQDVPEAFNYFATGQVRGKLIIDVVNSV